MTAKTYIGTSTALKMDAAAASSRAEHVRDEAHAEYDVVAAESP